MRAVDIIEKKKQGKVNTDEELKFLIDGYLSGKVEDYQMSAWLMAVCFNGLNFDETLCMTKLFVESGDVLNFEDFDAHIADKHSTGGVGDKVTLVLIPLIASLGVACAKVSGRGLGMTGGTIDKLESISGFNCALTEDEFKNQIKKINAAISSQTPNLVPADGKIYALRDVTATVDNMSLICASVVSKKIASGADIIVLDIKYGSGAFVKTKEEAKTMADLMVAVGKKLNRKIDAVISSMEQPLGNCVGNSLEVIESIEFLRGKMAPDLYEVVVEIAAKILVLANIATNFDSAKNMIDVAINSGTALAKFKEIIEAQGGNPNVTEDYSLFQIGTNTLEIKTDRIGYVHKLDALSVAKACKLLGAGREKKTDSIDFGAGCILNAKVGDNVQGDDVLATLFFNNVHADNIQEAYDLVLNAFDIQDEFIAPSSVIMQYEYNEAEKPVSDDKQG